MKIRLLLLFSIFSIALNAQMNIYPQIRGCECLPVITARFDGTVTKADSVYVDSIGVLLRFCSGGGCGTYTQRLGIEKVYFRDTRVSSWSSTDYYNQSANDTLNARIKRKLLNNGLPFSNWGSSFGTQEDDIHCLAVGRTKDPPTGVGGSNGAFPTAPLGKYHSLDFAMPYNWFLNKVVTMAVTGCNFRVKGGGIDVVTWSGGVQTRNAVSATVGALELACNYVYTNSCATTSGGWGFSYNPNFWGHFTKSSLSYVWRNYRNDIFYGNADYWAGYELHIASFLSPQGNRCRQAFDFSLTSKSQAENSFYSNQIVNSFLQGTYFTSPCLNNYSATWNKAVRFNNNGLDLVALNNICGILWHVFQD